MLLDQLFRPLGYLLIRHPYKWVVDWAYPVTLATLSIIVLSILGDIRDAIEPGGIMALTLSFIQSLPGFYIAALAAIATFGRSDIDSILPEPTPRIKKRTRNTDNWVALTRRRFLAMLFAFLTAESIVLTLSSIGILAHESSFPTDGIWLIVTDGLVFLYLVLLFQMIAATFWGLYYLGYKLHE